MQAAGEDVFAYAGLPEHEHRHVRFGSAGQHIERFADRRGVSDDLFTFLRLAHDRAQGFDFATQGFELFGEGFGGGERFEFVLVFPVFGVFADDAAAGVTLGDALNFAKVHRTAYELRAIATGIAEHLPADGVVGRAEEAQVPVDPWLAG